MLARGDSYGVREERFFCALLWRGDSYGVRARRTPAQEEHARKRALPGRADFLTRTEPFRYGTWVYSSTGAGLISISLKDAPGWRTQLSLTYTVTHRD
ncbi:MAG TPA: hypothetical protein VEZ90_10440 [Blastocatellia bacterium]|nr:hypothetical protein [Blastocatellia bacterium]